MLKEALFLPNIYKVMMILTKFVSLYIKANTIYGKN